MKTWWCRSCEKWTGIEFNPEWIADGKPFKWCGKEYGWFVRCARCGHDHFQRSWYACPKCGWDAFPEDAPDDKYYVNWLGKVVVVAGYWKEVDEKDGTVLVKNEKAMKPVEKKNAIYPIIEHFHSSSSIEGSFIEWDETHCCPKHGPFKFSNGN